MSCLHAPDYQFWERQPYSVPANFDRALVAVSRSDEEVVECSRVLVSERHRRERFLREERLARVCLVKNVIYLLHLARTEDCLRGGKRVVQAHDGASLALEMLCSREEKERAALEGYEQDVACYLTEEVLPRLIALADVLSFARAGIFNAEQEYRHVICTEEAASYEELKFKRSVLRHTECVVTQYTREDCRVAAINEKMDRLGYCSLGTGARSQQQPPDSSAPPSSSTTAASSPALAPALAVPTQAPASRAPSSAASSQDAVYAAAAAPPRTGSSAAADAASSLRADTEFLETHLMGLRALRVAEEEKLRSTREQLALADDLLQMKKVLLEDAEGLVSVSGAASVSSSP
eukprot:Rhum_TRINITY_DN5191_c0_g2::Rhum_TRINITY_DN5191_c0_g2_i1::g.16491::m.16491